MTRRFQKTLMLTAATAAIAAATIAAPSEAQARCRGCWVGAGVAAAAVGGAIAASNYGYWGNYRYAPDYGSYGWGYSPAYYGYYDYPAVVSYGYPVPAYYAPRYYPYYGTYPVYYGPPRYYW